MSNFSIIQQKLEVFIRRYYINEIIKGGILFAVLGLLAFFLVTFLEYTFWLNSFFRAVLFWGFIVLCIFLFYKFLGIPLLQLFRLKKVLDPKKAAVLIGKHFNNLDDKLLNILELNEQSDKTDLILAGIEQKSATLSPIPFQFAIKFQRSIGFLKWLIVPAVIFLLLFISGSLSNFLNSYDRVSNYATHFEAPAPFKFKILNKDLRTLEREEFQLKVTTVGEVNPAECFLVINDESFLMNERDGHFSFVFPENLKTSSFYFKANEVVSQIYQLDFLNVPSIQNMSMKVKAPNYLNKPIQTYSNTGNITIYEGSKIDWVINGNHIHQLNFIKDSLKTSMKKDQNNFKYADYFKNNFTYTLEVSSNKLIAFESLDYVVDVIKDERPEISVTMMMDSLQPNIRYFVGESSDDHGLQKVVFHIYETENPDQIQTYTILKTKASFEKFYYNFPDGLKLANGKMYMGYFTAWDNDAVNGSKFVKSELFDFRLKSNNELDDLRLDNQKNAISGLNKTAEKLKEQNNFLDQFSKNNTQKKQLDFNDQHKIKDFIKRKEQLNHQMKKFSRNLKDNLMMDPNESAFKEKLKERLERQEKEFQKNEKLLDELNKVTDKINKEDLKKKVEELAKEQKNSERSLEQILELTKRFYVTQKANRIAKDLKELSQKQDSLSKDSSPNNNSKVQDQLAKEFDQISEQISKLKEDNQKLKKPVKIDASNNEQQKIKERQKQASDELIKQSSPSDKAKQKQKSAAQKMKQMSEDMMQAMSGGASGETMEEDMEMLRQILDNLVVYSLEQEGLMDNLSEKSNVNYDLSKDLRVQKQLKEAFQHVDDSLFAISLRNPQIGEDINKELTEVFFNIDKTLEFLAERQISFGVTHQQYAITSSNALAALLADVQDNMQMSMSQGSGSGDSNSFQLPDIIQSQEELAKKSGDQSKQSGKENGKSEGNFGKEQQGSSGKDGKEEGGKDGNKGKKEGNKSGEGKQGKGGKGDKGENEGKGEGNGNDGEGSNGNGISEKEMQQIYEIYQQQQLLRSKLEKQLENIKGKGFKSEVKNIIKAMEDIEDRLLENGITPDICKRMDYIKHQLLKLREAEVEQGEESKRESQNNFNKFSGIRNARKLEIQEYLNQLELLNRQVLPLQNLYKQKVNSYFNKGD